MLSPNSRFTNSLSSDIITAPAAKDSYNLLVAASATRCEFEDNTNEIKINKYILAGLFSNPCECF